MEGMVVHFAQSFSSNLFPVGGDILIVVGHLTAQKASGVGSVGELRPQRGRVGKLGAAQKALV